MIGLLAAFFSSFIATFLIIRFKHLHEHLSSDSDLSGPQKFHTNIVPRIGGVSITVGLFLAIAIKINSETGNLGLLAFACAIPAFAIGLTEDITKTISIRTRLIVTAISALLASCYLNLDITHIDIPYFDFLFSIPAFGILFVVFAISGLANSYNIIDGFHGLSSMVGILTLLSITYVAYIFGDTAIIYFSLVMAASILGFFIWNYPQGLIFLGDGGAYIIGFWVATFSILICSRHPEISPWFALLINGYPIMETLFTIYRRKIHQGKNPGKPDGIHFHTLIFRRILRSKYSESRLSANARTAPYLWVLAGLSICPALIWWKSTPILICICIVYSIFYIWIYSRIIQFRTPRWMRFN